MFYTFGRYKRSLLTVLGVLLASTLATASAATINMSQLTSNTAQPVVINSMPSNVDTTTPTTYFEGCKHTCFNSNCWNT